MFHISERVVNTLGNQKAIDIYNKTKDAEKNGGLMILVSFESN